MQDNIQKVMDRGERLDTLQVKTGKLYNFDWSVSKKDNIKVFKIMN